MKQLLLLCLCWLAFSSQAYDNLDIALENGTDLNINRFDGDGETLLLWLPSERGFGQGYVSVALDLATMDFDVWTANLHETYIIPSGRDSLDEVELDDIVALFSAAEEMGFKQVFLVSSSRGVQLALRAAYLWQQQHPAQTLLRGLITFSPHLVKGRPEMGESASYLDIAAHSNLPMYMIQAQHSTKYARSWEIARQLQRGGSPVYVHFLRGVQGGFHMRPEEDLTEVDLDARAALAEVFQTAIALLRDTASAPLIPGYEIADAAASSSTVAMKQTGLHRFNGNPDPAPLILTDLEGRAFDLQNSKDQVILVNFWATWCGPCVEEIPSLSRLVQRMQGKPFKVLAVNIGESSEDIRLFLEKIPINFDVLLDSNGNAVRDWKVYAYPSNYLIDREGKIRYAYRGALEWDAPEVVATIESLM